MASVDAAGDPLSAATSATSLLLWTLGPAAAAAASPSRACGALLGGPLKRSKELMEQARVVLKERGDIHKLYQEDGVNGATSAAMNGKNNNQQARRPGLDRKRARFSLMPQESNPVQDVDFSKLQTIEDPKEYFSALADLEELDKEMKKLRGEVPTEAADHHRPLEPPKKRPGMSRRKSAYSYNFSAGVDTPDVIEGPVSHIETITESQSTQDNMAPSVPERTKLLLPSSSSQCDIPDVSVREDSFAENQILGKDVLNDKADISEDDESDNSPGIVTGKQSSGHSPYNSVVSMGGEASTGRETPTSRTKSPDHVLEPVQKIPNRVSTDEIEPRSSSFSVCIDSEVAKEKDASSGHNISLEDDDVGMDQPVSEGPNSEPTMPSHHLEGDTTEVLGSSPGRNVSALYDEDDNIEHQGGVGGDGLVQDKPIHTPEIPPEDIDLQNPSHIDEGNFEKPAVHISNQLFPSKDSKQKQVQDVKKKQPLRRGKRGAEEASDPLRIPPENSDTETQPHMQDTEIEQQTVGTTVVQSPNNGNGGNGTQRRKKRKELDRRKSLAGPTSARCNMQTFLFLNKYDYIVSRLMIFSIFMTAISIWVFVAIWR